MCRTQITLEGLAVIARHVHAKFLYRLLNRRPLQFQQRGLRPRHTAVCSGGQHTQFGELQCHQIDLYIGQALGEYRVLQQGLAAVDFRTGQLTQLLQVAFRLSHFGNGQALVHQQRLGIGPALALFADKVFRRHSCIVEVNLIQVIDTVDRVNGTYGHARGRHVDQQKTDAILLAATVVGAHQAEYPVGGLGEGGPDFTAVDHVVITRAIAIPLRLALQ